MKVLTLFKYLSNKRKYQILILLIFMIINAFSEVLSIRLIYPFLELISKNNGSINDFGFLNQFLNNQNQTFLVPLFFIVSIIFLAIFRIIWVYMRYAISALVGTDLNKYIFRNNLNKTYLDLINLDSSELVAVSSIHIEKTTNAINNFLELITSIFILVSIIFTLLNLNFKFTLSTLFIFISFYILIVIIVKDKLLVNSKIIAEKNNKQIKLIQETFNSFRIIIIHNTRSFFEKTFAKQEYLMRMKNAENKFFEETPRSVAEAIGISILVIYASLNLSSNNNEIIPLLGTFAFASQRLLPAFQRAFSNMAAMRSRYKDIDIVIKFLKDNKIKKDIEENIEDLKFSESIIFKNVSFKYNQYSPYILKNLNFEINSGDKVAIVGKTGSGKSTLIDLILGLIYPTEGEILIDGKKLSRNSDKSINKAWRNIISIVPQKIYLMDTSIAKNIAFTFDESHINFKKINKIVKLVDLYDFINSDKVGLDYLVGEMGNLLSGGQIQRIAIARAIYKDSEIIIFDEATSSLDTETSRKINDNLMNNFSNKTFIEISHKFKNFDPFNKVLKIEDGRLLIIKNN